MQFFYNIKELLTLQGARKKGGRHIEEKDLSIIRDAGILEDGGKIIAAGTEKDINTYVYENKIKASKVDCENMVVLPGFVDCHTHPVFHCNRFREFEKRIAGASYLEISQSGGGINASINGTRGASKDLLIKKTKKYLKAMMKYGTTSVEGKSGYGLSIESEIKMLEVLKNLNEELVLPVYSTFLGAHAFPPEFKGREEKYVDLIVNEMLPRIKEENLATMCDVFCDRGFFSNRQTEKIVKKAIDLGFKITLHVDELEDTDGTSLAVDCGAISASHLLCINKSNIKKLARSDTIGIMLPGTPFFLAERKFAPARELLDCGARLSISTDFNPGSNMCYNMPLTLTQAALFMNMTLPEAIVGGTYLGAMALSIDNTTGTIERNKDLNISLFETSCYQEIFCHYGENHCKRTYIRGVSCPDR